MTHFGGSLMRVVPYERTMSQSQGGSAFQFRKDWRHRRPEQGYAYGEVKREITRRAKGEYVLTPEARDVALARALRDLEIRYKLSALLSDFLHSEGLTPESLVDLLDCNAGDAINFSLDPFSCHGERPQPIENDTLIDLLYPGKDFVLDRDELARKAQK